MIDFIKRIFLFAIGVFVILFLFKTVLGNFSLSNTVGEITKSFAEIRKLGQSGGSGGGIKYGSSAGDNQKGALSKYTSTSKGAEAAVTFINLSRGEMVDKRNTIIGNIQATWLVDGVGTARFLNELGESIGSAQVITAGVPDPKGIIGFSIAPQFIQGSTKTGYLIIEKVNNTGQTKNDAWVSLPITYPVTESAIQNSSATTTETSNTPTRTGGIQYGRGNILAPAN